MAALCPAGPDPITMRSYFSMSKGESITFFGENVVRVQAVRQETSQLQLKVRTERDNLYARGVPI